MDIRSERSCGSSRTIFPEQTTSAQQIETSQENADAPNNDQDANEEYPDGEYGDEEYADGEYGGEEYGDGEYGDGEYGDGEYGDEEYAGDQFANLDNGTTDTAGADVDGRVLGRNPLHPINPLAKTTAETNPIYNEGYEEGDYELCECPATDYCGGKDSFKHGEGCVLCQRCDKSTGSPSCLCPEPEECKEYKGCDICLNCNMSLRGRKARLNKHKLTPEETSAIISDCKSRGYSVHRIYQIFSQIRSRADYQFSHASGVDHAEWVASGLMRDIEREGPLATEQDGRLGDASLNPSRENKAEDNDEPNRMPLNPERKPRSGGQSSGEVRKASCPTEVEQYDEECKERETLLSASSTDTEVAEDAPPPLFEPQTRNGRRFKFTSVTYREAEAQKLRMEHLKSGKYIDHTQIYGEDHKTLAERVAEKKARDEAAMYEGLSKFTGRQRGWNGEKEADRRITVQRNRERLDEKAAEAVKEMTLSKERWLPTAAETQNPAPGGNADTLIKMDLQTEEDYERYFARAYGRNWDKNKAQDEAFEQRLKEEHAERVANGFPKPPRKYGRQRQAESLGYYQQEPVDKVRQPKMRKLNGENGATVSPSMFSKSSFQKTPSRPSKRKNNEREGKEEKMTTVASAPLQSPNLSSQSSKFSSSISSPKSLKPNTAIAAVPKGKMQGVEEEERQESVVKATTYNSSEDVDVGYGFEELDNVAQPDKTLKCSLGRAWEPETLKRKLKKRTLT